MLCYVIMFPLIRDTTQRKTKRECGASANSKHNATIGGVCLVVYIVVGVILGVYNNALLLRRRL
jgi:hypothetical protein